MANSDNTQDASLNLIPFGVGISTKSTVVGGHIPWYAVDAGTSANTYVVSLGSGTSAPTALAAGMMISFLPANTNTGASTLNVNGIGATAIVFNGVAVPAGDIAKGIITTVQYDGTSFELIASAQNPGPTTLATSIGSVTVTNTLTATSLVPTSTNIVGTPTVPANSLVPGSTLRIRSAGTVAGNSATLVLAHKVGAASFANSAVTAGAGTVYTTELDISCRSAGTAGVLCAAGYHNLGGNLITIPQSTAGVSTNASNLVDLAATWSTTAGTITQTNYTLELL